MGAIVCHDCGSGCQAYTWTDGLFNSSGNPCDGGYWHRKSSHDSCCSSNCSTTLSFASGTSSITEGNSGTSVHTITVNRAGYASGTATVDYATSNGTATAGSDYTATSGTLSFGPGVTSQTISITITGDTLNENNEGFNVTLSNPTQTLGSVSITGTNPHVVTITNDDTSNFSFSSSSSNAPEGDSGTSTHSVDVTRSDTNGTATIDYATSDVTATSSGSNPDYVATSGTLSFNDGQATNSISVTIIGDTIHDDGQTFIITLSNPSSQYGNSAITLPSGNPGGTSHLVNISEGASESENTTNQYY